MDDFKAYLARLAQDLKESSPAEQDEILAEIESHIEEGLEDRRMGAGGAERGAKVLMELGSPTEMADGLYYAQARRWQGLALALIPLAIVFLEHFIITEVLLPEKIAANDSYLVNLILMPIYLLMVLVSTKRQSLMLTLWCLSWVTLQSGSGVLWGIIYEIPLWARLIFGIVFALSLAIFARKLWQSRQNGLLVAFSTLPFILSTIQMPILTAAFTYSNPSSSDNRQIWMSGLLLSFYITLLALLFLLPSRKMRWLSLIGSVTMYLLLLAWLLQPLSIIYLVPYSIILSLPLMTGLMIDYQITRTSRIAP